MYEELDSRYQSLCPESVESFIADLRAAAKDDNYGIAAFLRDRIDDEIDSIQSHYRGNLSDEDKAGLTLKARTIATYLLLLGKTEGHEFQQKYLLLLETLSVLSPRSAISLAGKAADCLCGKVSSLGFSWIDITTALSADILAYKITITAAGSASETRTTLTRKGSVDISSEEIKLSPYPSEEAGLLTKSMGILSDRIGLWTKDRREERLKASEASNVRSIETFINDFCTAQLSCRPPQKEELKKYREGDSMPVLVTGFDDNGDILVKTINPSYKELSGRIEDTELVVGLKVSDFAPYLFSDSCFADAVFDEYDGSTAYFSIYDSYVDYADKQANYARRNRMLVSAKATRMFGSGKINWISFNGVGMITDSDPSVKVGDVRTLTVLSTKENSNGYYVNAQIAGTQSPVPGMEFAPDKVLKYFSKELEYIRKDFVKPHIFSEAQTLKDSTVRSLATILLSVRNERATLEHYRMLCVARVLYTLVGDIEKASFARGRASYVKNCILFARGESLMFPERDIEYNSEDQRKMLSTLLCLGNHDREGALCALLSIVPADSPLARVARLILAKNTALLSENDFGFSDAALRREIAGILGVSDVVLDEDCADIPTGKYGNTERQFREFKSSYVYRNDDTGADFQKQGREEVFQAVCGLLNTDGGQVYVGVNNNGDPITDSSWGIAADIKWLKANYVKVNGLRRDALGHNVPKVTDIDSYVNFLCEEKRIYFKDSVLENIIIEPTEDMDAICITVSPSGFEIAYLYEDATHSVGQAFRRDGNRTIPMTEVEKQKRLMKLQSIGKEVDFQIRIQEAIDQHRKIILKDYASSEVRDRFLAPINLLYGGESVWCVDLEDPNRTCKQFRLSRASGVEVKDEKYPHGKSPVESDIFRFTGEKTIHVKLRMNISAKNYLMEEYPQASRLSEKEFYKSEEGWILDTMVSNIIGVRRFYIGLADKVEILETEDSEAIRQNIRDYLSKSVNPAIK